MNTPRIINLKPNFKVNIIKKDLGERIKKGVVINCIRIESYFLPFTEEWIVV